MPYALQKSHQIKRSTTFKVYLSPVIYIQNSLFRSLLRVCLSSHTRYTSKPPIKDIKHEINKFLPENKHVGLVNILISKKKKSGDASFLCYAQLEFEIQLPTYQCSQNRKSLNYIKCFITSITYTYFF